MLPISLLRSATRSTSTSPATSPNSVAGRMQEIFVALNNSSTFAVAQVGGGNDIIERGSLGAAVELPQLQFDNAQGRARALNLKSV